MRPLSSGGLQLVQMDVFGAMPTTQSPVAIRSTNWRTVGMTPPA